MTKTIRMAFSALMLLLLGCGGGGGGSGASDAQGSDPAQAAFSAATQANFQYRRTLSAKSRILSTQLDMRFDTLGLAMEGIPSEDFRVVKPFIDSIKATGFNTIVFGTNIPIDLTTGRVSFDIPSCTQSDCHHPFPKHFWWMVAYAKQIGLGVVLNPQIVDVKTDNFLSPQFFQHNIPATMTWSQVLQNAFEYQTALATEAQKYAVDGFHVGFFHFGLDTNAYLDLWKTQISQLRKVFGGYLIYSSCEFCYTPLWNLVDQIDLHISPVLSTSKVYDVDRIVALYANAIGKDGGTYDIKAQIAKVAATYQKPITVNSKINLGDKAVGPIHNLNRLITPSGDGVYGNGYAGGMQYISNFEVDHALQGARFEAFYRFTLASLGPAVNGLTVNEFQPWVNKQGFQNPCAPADVSCPAWQAFNQLGMELYYNEKGKAQLKILNEQYR